jgi:hypothetical protein
MRLPLKTQSQAQPTIETLAAVIEAASTHLEFEKPRDAGLHVN